MSLRHELKQLAYTHKEGAFATQHARRAMLELCGTQLWEKGYRIHPDGLKGRHVQYLVQRWQDEGIATATLKNRLSVLRWWAMKVGNPGAIKPDNAAYGIAQRQTVARESKARDVSRDQLARVRNAYVKRSLLLQRAFGLRREESLKSNPGTLIRATASCSRPRGPRVDGPARFPSVPLSNGRCSMR